MEKSSYSVRTGLAFGAVVGALHLLWSGLVFFGCAKPYLDFVLSMHFITLNYEIQPFKFGKAILLVLITSFLGFMLGFIFSKIWHKFGNK